MVQYQEHLSHIPQHDLWRVVYGLPQGKCSSFLDGTDINIPHILVSAVFPYSHEKPLYCHLPMYYSLSAIASDLLPNEKSRIEITVLQ